MAFRRLFVDFKDKYLANAWDELNRRIERAVSAASFASYEWATDVVPADDTRYFVGLDGGLAATPGHTWSGNANQAEKPFLVRTPCSLRELAARVDVAPGVTPGVLAFVYRNGTLFAVVQIDAAATSTTYTFSPELPLIAGDLLSMAVQNAAGSATTRVAMTATCSR